MNTVSLIGRLTKEVFCNYTEGEKPTAYARFTLAVDGIKDEDTSFISCVAFGKTAEILNDSTKKGARVGIIGHIKTGSYTNKDGKKVYTTDVVADRVNIIDYSSKQQEEDLPFH